MPASASSADASLRDVADRIDAVIWFSDLRGFTRITDTAPEQAIPLLNDYADVVFSAIREQGGRCSQADRRRHACDIHAPTIGQPRLQRCAVGRRSPRVEGVAALNQRRAADDLPITDVYLGLHVGEVFYGNIGSPERLDFTVIGPAVNEASRIAAMCRSVDQPLLVSAAFANVGDNRKRLMSVGRYALRGLSRPQELFTLDPDAVT